MYQIDNPSSAAVRPASTALGVPGWFTPGNPATSTPATVVDAEWLNMIMAELVAVLAAAGVAPNKAQSNQLLTAIDDLIASGGSASAASIASAVASQLYGIAAVPVLAGQTVLTAPQFGNGILNLTGALTGAASLVFPNAGRWLVNNKTTGAYNLTCTTAAGTGYIARQGFGYRIYADGVNIQPDGQQFFWGTGAAPVEQAQEAYLQTAT